MDKQIHNPNQETRGWRDRGLRSALRLACAVCLLPFAAANAQGLPFTENFDNGDFKNSDATTADWETTPGSLTLPLAGSSLVQSLNGALEATDAAAIVDVSEDVSTRAVALGDLDGDGDLDIAFGNNGTNSIYFNDGFGGFVRGSSIPGVNDHFGSNTRSAAIADFNGDGHLDVAFAEFGEGQSSRVLFNNGAGAPQIFTAGDFVDLGPPGIKGDSLAVGDIDNDGDMDVVIGALSSYVQIVKNDGFGNFADPISIADPLSVFGFHPRTVLLGDLDLDGDLDIVAALEKGTNRIYLQNPDGSFAAPQVAGAGELNKLDSPDSVSLGDVDGDGWLDLIVGNDGSGVDGEPNRIYLNSGVPATIFPAPSATFGGLTNTNSARLADIDQDGDLDIVTGEMLDLTQPAPNLLFLNDGTGTFDAGNAITASVDVTKSVAIGDVTGDGQLDLVFANDPERISGSPVAGTAVNETVENNGVPSGIAADQLFATAVSIRVDNGEDLSGGVRLEPSVANTPANPALSYWMSADGGSRWVNVQPNRAISFPAGGAQDLRWRIDFNTPSTNALWRPSVASLLISANRPARINSTAITEATQDVAYSYTITAVDPDGDDIEIRAASTLPAWLTLTDNGNGTALLTGTPSNDDWLAGPDYLVTIEAMDGSQVVGPLGSQEFTIIVANVNDAPAAVVPTGDRTYAQADVVNLDAGAAFQDADGDAMTFSATGLPASLAIDTATGVISGTLTNDDAINGPDYAVVVTADDGNLTGQDAFTLTVTNVNDPPTIDSTPPATGIIVGQSYTYNIIASDIDGDPLVIAVSGQPAWLTFTDNGDGTATLTGTPAAGQEGVSNIAVTADDGNGGTDEQAFTLTVTADNTPPTISVLGEDPITIEAGDTYTDAGATASDAEDGDLTSGIDVDDPVDASTPGTYTVTYTVTDSGGLTATATRTVNVVEANTAPTITVLGDDPVNLTTGNSYTDAGATASDAQDGDLTSLIAVDNPVDTSVAGTYTVTYTVTDSGGLSASATRTVIVSSPPPPPPPPPSSSGGGGSFGPLGLLLVSTFLLAVRRRRLLA